MSIFSIKCIAVITMVIDHVGLFFFPGAYWMRIIGRLSFPLFAWLIGNGARHTRSIETYLMRIVLLAAVSQIPFSLVNVRNGEPIWFFNVLFTFSFALGVILVFQRTQNFFVRFLALCIACTCAFLCNTDYGVAGVLITVAFYLTYGNTRAMFVTQGFLLGVLPFLFTFIERYNLSPIHGIYLASNIEPIGLLSLGIIYVYNGELGYKFKYTFYLFYPVQYALLYIGQLLFLP